MRRSGPPIQIKVYSEREEKFQLDNLDQTDPTDRTD